jgi:hypothetical protein
MSKIFSKILQWVLSIVIICGQIDVTKLIWALLHLFITKEPKEQVSEFLVLTDMLVFQSCNSECLRQVN